MPTENSASTWSEAFERARDPGYPDEIVVAREAEPELPATMALRRSPPPLSLRKGATAVYRQDEPGEHYRIREYEDCWSVAFQQHNPRYAPLKHLAADADLASTVAAGLGLRFGGGPARPTRDERPPTVERRQ